jgi:hypothetical protein
MLAHFGEAMRRSSPARVKAEAAAAARPPPHLSVSGLLQRDHHAGEIGIDHQAALLAGELEQRPILVLVKARAGAMKNISPASPPATTAARIRLKNDKNAGLASIYGPSRK